MIEEMLNTIIDTHEQTGYKIAYIELGGDLYQHLRLELAQYANHAAYIEPGVNPPQPSAYRGIQLRHVEWPATIRVVVRRP